MTTEARYLRDSVIKQMVGTRIVGAFTDADEEFAGFTIEFLGGKRKDVWVLTDPEGNGCGFLEVTDSKGK